MRLQGKTAFITGSAQGIGRAIAQRLAQEGADIVIHDLRDDERTQQTLALVTAAGRRACIVVGDVGNVADDYRVIEQGAQQMGRIDILVNNAGIEKHAAFWDTSEADYDQVVGVNQKGVFFTTQAFVRHLRQTGRGGKIINISSVHEELPMPNFTSYCASKGGVMMMMRNLSLELAPLGITINNIAPGAIETPMNAHLLNSPKLLHALLDNIPLRRLGKPEDVAGVAAFLASADADYITGTTVRIDGGLLWNYQEQ
jgi:glucose 1-dehydrogenase